MVGPVGDVQPEGDGSGPGMASDAPAVPAADAGHADNPVPSFAPAPALEPSLLPSASIGLYPDATDGGAESAAPAQKVHIPPSDDVAVAEHATLTIDAGVVPASEPLPDPLNVSESNVEQPAPATVATGEAADLPGAANCADIANSANICNAPESSTPSGATEVGFDHAGGNGQATGAPKTLGGDDAPPFVATAEPIAVGNGVDVAATGAGLPSGTGADASPPFDAAAAAAPAADSLDSDLSSVPEGPAAAPEIADIGAWRAPEPVLPSLDAPITPAASKLSLHPDAHSDWTPSVELPAAPEPASAQPDFSRMWSTPRSAMAATGLASATDADAPDTGWHSLASDAPAAGQPARRNWKALAYRTARIGFFVLVGWFAFVLALVVVYRFVNPPFSMLMAQQWLTGTSIQKQWKPLEQISPNLQRAVVVSEDSRFCQHWGIDLDEMANAIRRSSGGYPRGASTITMQLAKNLFLLPTKSYLRKMVEVPLTVAIELTWPKARILEVYLNVVEWGPGVFGAEAASRTHFKRSASQLTPRQAAQMAVSLPNPIVRSAGRPGPLVRKRAGVIQQRAAGARGVLACVAKGR